MENTHRTSSQLCTQLRCHLNLIILFRILLRVRLIRAMESTGIPEWDQWDEEFEEQLVMDLIEEQLVGELLREPPPTCHRKRRAVNERVQNFYHTPWGQLIENPESANPKSALGKKFRRRFRMPFPLFLHLVDLCEEHNIFFMRYRSRIPIEAKVLACLRILGRGSCADDISELSSNMMSESTIHPMFRTFVKGVQKHLFPLLVRKPEGTYLQEVLALYARLGLPGACGSMDCTRIKWWMCPTIYKFKATGKEGYPTLVFQVVVDHLRRVHHVSKYFLGSSNDVMICQNDDFTLEVMAGALDDVEYELYDQSGNKYKCRGGYLIVDGGYIDHIRFVDPDKHRISREAVLWSEWMESVRKDVECFFGILKARFRFFKHGVEYHDAETIEAAFKTAATFHNMILIFDRRYFVKY